MKMKLLMFTALCCLGLSGIVAAMPPKEAPDFQRLAAELQVTDDQKEAFLAIMRDQHEKRKALHQQGRDNIKAHMDSLDQSLVSQLESLLSPAQMEEFTARMEKRKQEMKKHRMLKHRSAH